MTIKGESRRISEGEDLRYRDKSRSLAHVRPKTATGFGMTIT